MREPFSKSPRKRRCENRSWISCQFSVVVKRSDIREPNFAAIVAGSYYIWWIDLETERRKGFRHRSERLHDNEDFLRPARDRLFQRSRRPPPVDWFDCPVLPCRTLRRGQPSRSA